MYVYSFFHLNLAFSSIEEEARIDVINRCYWPLLRLIRDHRLPMGIEASGFTLETVAALDPQWIVELRALCAEGLAEFIGSGYAQLIGPLVPAAVNRANQRIGLKTYHDLLGFRPSLALVGEQAYSAGLVPLYREAGYSGIIMDWDNAGSTRADWDPAWQYLPQRARGVDDSSIPLIWSKSIPFQQFQRYAHGEITLADYRAFLDRRTHGHKGCFALYGNDAEVFDYRPGRFDTEPPVAAESEWERIGHLYHALKQDRQFRLVKPSAALELLSRSNAGNVLRLESSEQPIPVKKQRKYNILRWALSGRDDLALNSDCMKIFLGLSSGADATEDDWKRLCYLWSSDFRTHVTQRRWHAMREELAHLTHRFDSPRPAGIPTAARRPEGVSVKRDGVYLEVETDHQRLRLNCRRGLAIEGWWDKGAGEEALIGTLRHGYFDNIHFGADFYSGHFVFDIPGKRRITDLVPVDPSWRIDGEHVVVSATVETPIGQLTKHVTVDLTRATFLTRWDFQWPTCPNGSLRLGHITLNPLAFDQHTLFYRTHNGGEQAETFALDGKPIDHLAPVSPLVSANQGLGITSGRVELGDDRRQLCVDIDRSAAAVTGHVLFAPVDDRYLFRLIFSAMEIDDTSAPVDKTTFANRSVGYALWNRGG